MTMRNDIVCMFWIVSCMISGLPKNACLMNSLFLAESKTGLLSLCTIRILSAGLLYVCG